jgi:hypothetical protein
MLADQITLDDVDASDHIYAKTKSLPDGAYRLDTTTDLTSPRSMTIRHSTQGKGSALSDRHNIIFSTTAQGANGPVVTSVSLTVVKARDAVSTDAEVKDLIAQLVDFLSDGASTTFSGTTNIAAILRGES